LASDCPLTDEPSPARAASLGRLSNEGLQQTRSALTSIAAALAAEPRCWAETCGLGLQRNGHSVGLNSKVHQVAGSIGVATARRGLRRGNHTGAPLSEGAAVATDTATAPAC
jgi:hypothetical protein